MRGAWGGLLSAFHHDLQLPSVHSLQLRSEDLLSLTLCCHACEPKGSSILAWRSTIICGWFDIGGGTMCESMNHVWTKEARQPAVSGPA